MVSQQIYTKLDISTAVTRYGFACVLNARRENPFEISDQNIQAAHITARPIQIYTL